MMLLWKGDYVDIIDFIVYRLTKFSLVVAMSVGCLFFK